MAVNLQEKLILIHFLSIKIRSIPTRVVEQDFTNVHDEDVAFPGCKLGKRYADCVEHALRPNMFRVVLKKVLESWIIGKLLDVAIVEAK